MNKEKTYFLRMMCSILSTLLFIGMGMVNLYQIISELLSALLFDFAFYDFKVIEPCIIASQNQPVFGATAQDDVN